MGVGWPAIIQASTGWGSAEGFFQGSSLDVPLPNVGPRYGKSQKISPIARGYLGVMVIISKNPQREHNKYHGYTYVNGAPTRPKVPWFWFFRRWGGWNNLLKSSKTHPNDVVWMIPTWTADDFLHRLMGHLVLTANLFENLLFAHAAAIILPETNIASENWLCKL